MLRYGRLRCRDRFYIPLSYSMLTAVKEAGRVMQITDKQSNEQFRHSVGILCLGIGSAQGVLMPDNKERIGPTSTPPSRIRIGDSRLTGLGPCEKKKSLTI